MFVNGGVEVGAEAVGGGPEFFVEVAEELLGGSGVGHKGNYKQCFGDGVAGGARVQAVNCPAYCRGVPDGTS